MRRSLAALTEVSLVALLGLMPIALLTALPASASGGAAKSAAGADKSAASADKSATGAGKSAASAGFANAAAKKGGSGVAVSYRIDGTPRAGGVANLVLQFSGITDPQGATIELSAEAPASLEGNKSIRLAPGSNDLANVAVNVPKDGVYFLNVFSQQGGRSAATSIPIQVGAGQAVMEKQGTGQVTKDGERVRSMPSK